MVTELAHTTFNVGSVYIPLVAGFGAYSTSFAFAAAGALTGSVWYRRLHPAPVCELG